MDKFRIDEQKLIYHPPRLHDWLRGKDIYPIYVEIASFGGCNHRCIFCAFDYLDYQPQALKKEVLLKRLSEMAKCGLKSVMYAGEGEPLLHKDLLELVSDTKKLGIDVSLTTNGVLLNRGLTDRLLRHLTWIRISLDAATPKTYAKIHRCDFKDFELVMQNITDAVRIRREKGYACTIGAQLLLLPENFAEVVSLAKKLKAIKIDYLTIKPYSQHPKSRNRMGRNIDYSLYSFLGNKLNKLSDENFKIIFRSQSMEKLQENRPYKRCLGLPFWSYIDAKGNIYACSAFLGDNNFCYGNIHRKTFKQIWQGQKRKEIRKMFAKKDTRYCRKACRMDEVNRYLWELKHPHPHVNFI